MQNYALADDILYIVPFVLNGTFIMRGKSSAYFLKSLVKVKKGEN